MLPQHSDLLQRVEPKILSHREQQGGVDELLLDEL